jgi:hypothetical protein
LRKRWKWAFGMPLWRLRVRLAWPEVLDPIDVIVAFARVGVGGINPMVMELGNVKNVIAG